MCIEVYVSGDGGSCAPIGWGGVGLTGVFNKICPELRLADLEWESPLENSVWGTAGRLGSKCLCSPNSLTWPHVYALGVENGVCQLCHFYVPQHTRNQICLCLSFLGAI